MIYGAPDRATWPYDKKSIHTTIIFAIRNLCVVVFFLFPLANRCEQCRVMTKILLQWVVPARGARYQTFLIVYLMQQNLCCTFYILLIWPASSLACSLSCLLARYAYLHALSKNKTSTKSALLNTFRKKKKLKNIHVNFICVSGYQ